MARRAETSPFASLRRFVQPRPSRRERCDLCSAALADEHDHLLELANRRISCACEPCAILFSSPAAPKYRRVPRRREHLVDFRLSDVDWAGLQLPIDLAFFVRSSAAGRVVAMYPSPAGATEALPPVDAWDEVVRLNPRVGRLESDVEALLVHRLGSARDHYIVGIDECYTLVGIVRTRWRGMSGGTAVWTEMAKFFASLKQRSRIVKEVARA
jgi:hypothetical protein